MEIIIYLAIAIASGSLGFIWAAYLFHPKSDFIDRDYIKSERQPTVPVEYHGWIYGNIEDKQVLRKLGVRGKMIWKASDNGKRIQPYAETRNGIFEYCAITMEVARKLRDNYPAFPPQTFTGIDKNGNQTIHQPLWKGEYED